MLYRLSERYPLPRCMLPYNLSQKILVQQTFSYIYTNSFMIKICTFLGFFIINYGMFSLSKKSFRIYRILKQKIISRIFFSCDFVTFCLGNLPLNVLEILELIIYTVLYTATAIKKSCNQLNLIFNEISSLIPTNSI